MAHQLGYLRCYPLLLLTFHSLLSQDRLSGSSKIECEETERDFQEQYTKFRLRSYTLETDYTSTFANWWDTYVKDFFGTLDEEVSNKLFWRLTEEDFHPKIQSNDSRYLSFTFLVYLLNSKFVLT